MSARRGSRLPLGRARAAVLWERVWPLVLPVFAVLGSFLAVALADLLPRLPGWLHVLVLASFAAALAWTVRHAFRGFRPVTDRVARHRLEVDNGLRHRPLTALVDHLASGAEDPRALVLWHAHLTRMAFSARKLRIRLPAPGVAGRDIYGLRAVVLLLLVVTFIAGHGDVAGRLGGALVPKFRSATEGPVGVDVWITPPAYTRLAPMFLDQEATSPAGPLRVPTGSAVLAQVSGVEAAPRLKVGAQETAFTAIGSTSGPGTHRVESVIDQGTRLAVEHDGRELAAWPMEVIPDSPPRVSFAAPPAPTRRSHLRLEYEAVDDYGLASVVVEIRRADGRNVPGGEDTVRLELPLAALGAPSAKGRSVRDLTPHPWAGLPVLIRLVATDGRDQTGTSEDVGIVLPERVFNHPVARAIIEQRKKLSSPSPEVRARVTVALNAIAGRPDLFDHDTVVFLALSVAQSRLMRDERAQAIPSVQRLLWDTALRIEDGEISIAERRLMRAQERLMQALRDGVENPELERLMDELQRAMEEYMEALAEQFLRQGAFDLPMLPDMEIIARDDLQQLIDRARELARMGNMDAARRMLSELRRMLENLRAGIRPGGPSRDMARVQEMMNMLRDLIQRQQNLLDRTFRRAERQAEAGRPGEESTGEGGSEAKEQEALRRALGELMLKLDEVLGGIPGAMGKAERAMRDAVEALDADRPGAAVPHQTEALEQLRQGAEGAMEQLARGMGGFFVMGPGQRMPLGTNRRFPERDPFGRVPDGNFGTAIDGDVKVPDKMEMRRAREILQELRRRAGQRQRPKPEREYIERLLRQF